MHDSEGLRVFYESTPIWVFIGTPTLPLHPKEFLQRVLAKPVAEK